MPGKLSTTLSSKIVREDASFWAGELADLLEIYSDDPVDGDPDEMEMRAMTAATLMAVGVCLVAHFGSMAKDLGAQGNLAIEAIVDETMKACKNHMQEMESLANRESC